MICVFDTDIGPMVQILVGATIVGSIETVWAGTVTPPREASSNAGPTRPPVKKAPSRWKRRRDGPLQTRLHGDQPVYRSSVQFAPQLHNGTVTRMGEAFAEIPAAAETPQTPL